MDDVEKIEVFSEAMICDKLNSKYIGNAKYKLANAFIFKYDWESDFFVQKQNGYAYEFEVKISRSDFFCDKNKVVKHLILETGKYTHTHRTGEYNYELRKTEWQEHHQEVYHAHRPNKFFYVVPEGLITTSEIPSYAGLMYVPLEKYKDIITVKEAPFIHKEKLSLESVLCNKFYNYWLQEKSKRKQLEYELKQLRFKIEQR